MAEIPKSTRATRNLGVDTGYVGLRCFIEGVEVPVSQATVKAMVMKSAIAKITIPASPEVMHFKPRSVVHLFYYDASKVGRKGRRIPVGHDNPQSIDKGNPYKWHLFFVGELHAFQYKKSGRGSQCVLTCADFTTYWESAKLYYGNKKRTHNHFKQAMFVGAVRAFSGKKKIKDTDGLLRVLRSAPTRVPQLGGLLGGVIHLLESLTGVYERRKGRARYRGINDFFTVSELRLHLTRMIGVCPNDTTSVQLTESTGFKRYVKQMAKRTQSTASYGELISLLLGRTYHMHTSVACPPYMTEGYKATHWRLVRAGKGLDPKVKDLDTWATGAEDALETVLRTRQNDVNGRGVNDPWQSHVEPDQTTKPDSGGQDTWKNTTLKTTPNVPADGAADAKLSDMPAYDTVSGSMNHAQWTALRDRITRIGACARTVHTQLGRAVEDGEGVNTYPEHTSANANAAIRLLAEARAKRRAIFRPRYVPRPYTHEINDQLNATIICPNLWMCPPPKCNIVFPAQYTSISYSRNWMSEATRMWVHGVKTDGKANWAESYFAPCSDIITHNTNVTDIAKIVQSGSSFLLRHEVFSGIIAHIQGVGDAAQLKKIHTKTEEVEQEEGAPNVKTWGTSLGHFMKNPALQRAANAKFMQARFNSRAMSIQGPFNPNLVCGLPGAVLDTSLSTKTPTLWRGNLDNPMDSPQTTSTDTGTHYLGLVSSITHSITQAGSSTSFTMNYSRAHNEGLEMFDAGWTKDQATAEVSRRGRGRSSQVPGKYWAEVLGWDYKYRHGRYESIPRIGMNGERTTSGKLVTWGLHAQGAPIKTDSMGGFRAAGPGGDGGGWNPIAKDVIQATTSGTISVGGVPTQLTIPALTIDRPLAAGQTLMGEVNTKFLQTRYGHYAYKYRITPVRYRRERNNSTPSDHRELEPEQRSILVGTVQHQIFTDMMSEGVLSTTANAPETHAYFNVAGEEAETIVHAQYGPPETRVGLARIKPKIRDGFTFHDGYKYTLPQRWMSSLAKGSVEVTAHLVGGQGTGAPFIYNFSFEQMARPPWFSDVYLNHNIGSKFYLPLIGCDAITDLTLSTLDASSIMDGTGYVKGIKTEGDNPAGNKYDLDEGEMSSLRALMTGVYRDPKDDLTNLEKLDAFVNELANGQFDSKTTLVVKKGEVEYEIPAKVLGGYHVQNCINHLAHTYSEMLQRNVNIQNFVDGYTNRNFACMVDIFGYGWKGDGENIQGIPDKIEDPGGDDDAMIPNPARDVVGTRHIVPSAKYANDAEWLAEKDAVDQTIEGFHSAAFGDVEPMKQLDWDLLSPESQIGDPLMPLAKSDPRKERRKMVQAYRDSVFGTGVAGRVAVRSED